MKIAYGAIILIFSFTPATYRIRFESSVDGGSWLPAFYRRLLMMIVMANVDVDDDG